ncbi:Tomoregulin-2 [Dirofilaria immitis]
MKKLFVKKISGECCTIDIHCNNTWQPICDQYGTMYPNRCYFDAKKCFLEKTNNVTLILAKCQRNIESEFLNITHRNDTSTVTMLL